MLSRAFRWSCCRRCRADGASQPYRGLNRQRADGSNRLGRKPESTPSGAGNIEADRSLTSSLTAEAEGAEGAEVEQGRSGADSDRRRYALFGATAAEAYCSPATLKAALVQRTFVLLLTPNLGVHGRGGPLELPDEFPVATPESRRPWTRASPRRARAPAIRPRGTFALPLRGAQHGNLGCVVEHEIRCDQSGDRQAEADPPVSPRLRRENVAMLPDAATSRPRRMN